VHRVSKRHRGITAVTLDEGMRFSGKQGARPSTVSARRTKTDNLFLDD